MLFRSALRIWTAVKWPEAQTDPAAWSPADATPGIYWRLVQLNQVETTAAVTWLNAQLVAHVLAPSPSVRLQWVRKVTEALAVQRRISLPGDGSPLQFVTVAADSEADQMRRGQVQLTARFGVLIPRPIDLILNNALITGIDKKTIYSGDTYRINPVVLS